MSNWINTFWKRYKSEIIPTVIGGVVLAIILSLSQQFRELAIKSLDKIKTEVSIPLYWVLSIFAFGVVLTRLLIWRGQRKQELFFYDSDEYAGFVWEWPALNRSNHNMTLLCPDCFTELDIRGEYQKKFTCTCGLDRTIEIPYYVLRDTAFKEFDRRERTGDSVNSEKRLKSMRRLARKRANTLDKALKEND
jgi:hypothetical protein